MKNTTGKHQKIVAAGFVTDLLMFKSRNNDMLFGKIIYVKHQPRKFLSKKFRKGCEFTQKSVIIPFYSNYFHTLVVRKARKSRPTAKTIKLHQLIIVRTATTFGERNDEAVHHLVNLNLTSRLEEMDRNLPLPWISTVL